MRTCYVCGAEGALDPHGIHVLCRSCKLKVSGEEVLLSGLDPNATPVCAHCGLEIRDKGRVRAWFLGREIEDLEPHLLRLRADALEIESEIERLREARRDALDGRLSDGRLSDGS